MSILELFEGQIKLGEILKTDIWLLSDLTKAKERLLEANAKARERQAQLEALNMKKGR